MSIKLSHYTIHKVNDIEENPYVHKVSKHSVVEIDTTGLATTHREIINFGSDHARIIINLCARTNTKLEDLMEKLDEYKREEK